MKHAISAAGRRIRLVFGRPALRLKARVAAPTALALVCGFAGCGGGNLEAAANQAVRGTNFTIKRVEGTGPNAGRAVAEADDGSKIEIKLSDVKDGGQFVLDRCQNVQDAGYNCTDLSQRPPQP